MAAFVEFLYWLYEEAFPVDDEEEEETEDDEDDEDDDLEDELRF